MITPTGTLTTLHQFCAYQSNCLDGTNPVGGLFQATNETFYATATHSGVYGYGTIFSLDVGLGPFVTLVLPFGKIGQTGGILGQGLRGATKVSLNGISASFIVKSDTLVVAVVPPGATTGYVTVSTPSGVLTSNVPFRVIQ